MVELYSDGSQLAVLSWQSGEKTRFPQIAGQRQFPVHLQGWLGLGPVPARDLSCETNPKGGSRWEERCTNKANFRRATKDGKYFGERGLWRIWPTKAGGKTKPISGGTRRAGDSGRAPGAAVQTNPIDGSQDNAAVNWPPASAGVTRRRPVQTKPISARAMGRASALRKRSYDKSYPRQASAKQSQFFDCEFWIADCAKRTQKAVAGGR
jgi:hypothetical protein